MNLIFKFVFCLFLGLVLFFPFLAQAAQSIDNFNVSSLCVGSQAQVNLNWSSSIGGNPNFSVLRKNQGDVNFIEVGSTSDLFYADTNGVESDKNYIYKIKAIKGGTTYFSSEGLASAAYCASVLSPPSSSCQLSGPFINLDWSSASGDVSAYKVFRDGVEINSGLDVAYGDGPDLIGTNNYNYFIRTIWQDGTFRDSGIFPIKALACSPNLEISSNCNSPGPMISLSWNSLLGVSEYQIYRKAQSESIFSFLSDTAGISYNDNLVSSLGSYSQGGVASYYVKAIWGSEQRDSNILPIDIPRCPPSLEVNTVCQVGNPQMDLDWTATLGANLYNIYRDNQFLIQITDPNDLFESDFLNSSNCPGKICTHNYRVDGGVAGVGTLSSNLVEKSIDCATIQPPSPPPVLDEPLVFCENGTSKISLNWSPSDNVTYYNIYRNSIQIAGILDTDFIDSGVQAGIGYNYHITAFGEGGGNVVSNNSSVVAADCSQPSQSILSLSSACEVGQPTATISWTDATNAMGYEIWKGSAPGALALLMSFSQSAPEFLSKTYKDEDVLTSTLYYYQIISKGPQGVASSSSSISSISTLSCLPSVPGLGMGNACLAGSPKINLSWETDGANTTRYEIFRDDFSLINPIKIINNILEKNWSDDVFPETLYNYKVEAVGYLDAIRSTQGYQPITSDNCALPGGFVLSDPILSCQGSYLQTNLSWTASSNADSYDIYRHQITPSKTDASLNVSSPLIDRGFSRALDFDGVNDYVEISNSSSLDISGTNITVSLWANVLKTTHDYVMIQKQWIADFKTAPHYQYAVEYDHQTNSADFYFGDTAGVLNGPFRMTIPLSVWTHITFTYDGAAVKGYVDGVHKFSTPKSTSIQARGNAVKIGVDAANGQMYKGKIDDIRIYDRALNAAEVSEHYQGIYNNENGLKGLWHFDEGLGAIASDSSNFGNNGSINGASWAEHGPQFQTTYNWQAEAIGPGGNVLSNMTGDYTMPICLPTKPGLAISPICQAGDSMAQLLWSFTTNTDKYEIHRQGAATNPIQTITSADSEFSTRIWKDIGLNIEENYTYWVKAIGPTGLVSQSDQIQITSIDCALPLAPQNLEANFWCTASSYPRINLSWDSSNNTDSYDVYRDGLLLTNVVDTNYTDEDVVVNTDYSYYVIPLGPGGSGPLSDVLDISAGYCSPSTPSISSLTTDCQVGSPANSISWTDDTSFNSNSYEIYRDNIGNPPVKIINQGDSEFLTKTWQDTLSLFPSTNYTYWVKTIGAAGEKTSSSRAISTYSCGVIPNAPVLSFLSSSCFQNLPAADLSWTQSANAYSYNLYRTDLDDNVSVRSTRVSPFSDRGEYALDFDGNDDYVEIPHFPNFLMNDGSVEFWFKADTINEPAQGIFSKDSSGFDTGGHLTLSLGFNKVGVRLQSVNSSYNINSSQVIASDVWYHVVFVFGSGGMKLYLNADAPDINSYTGGIGANSGGIGNEEPIAIGAQASQSGNKVVIPLNNFFRGQIDDVRIYARALSANEILDHFNGIYKNETELRGVWHFDENSGVVAFDDSVNNNDGAIKGPIWSKSETLQKESPYKYYIKAFGADTESVSSNEISLNTLSCLPATPDLSISSQCDALDPQLVLGWSADVNTDSWVIYKRRLGEIPWTVFPNTILTSYIDSDVESGADYEYYMEGIGNGEVSDPLSNLITKKAPFCFPAPTKPVITVAPQCYGYSSRMLIEWESTDNTISYNIWRKNITLGEAGFTKIFSGLPATVVDYLDSVFEDNKYIYQVEAVGSDGSVFSEESAEETSYECSLLPPFPPNLSLNFAPISTVDTRAVSLGWTDAGNEEKYIVFRRLEGAPEFVFQNKSFWFSWFRRAVLADYSVPLAGAEDIPADITNYVDFAVSENTSYEYQVMAVNINGSTLSNIIQVNVPIALPGGFNLSGVWSNEKIHLTWTQASFTPDGGPPTYDIYKDDSLDFSSPTILCSGIADTDPLECYDDNPNLFVEKYYKVVATNIGGQTDSNIIEMKSEIPSWIETAN